MPSCAVDPSPRTRTSACGERVADGDIAQHPVAGLPRGVEDDPDIHHDVDEQRVLGDERADEVSRS